MCLEHYSSCWAASTFVDWRESSRLLNLIRLHILKCVTKQVAKLFKKKYPSMPSHSHLSRNNCKHYGDGFQETRNHVAFSGSSKNEQGIEQNLPCWKNENTFLSSMSCHSCQLMWHSYSTPLRINHRTPTEVRCSLPLVTLNLKSVLDKWDFFNWQ